MTLPDHLLRYRPTSGLSTATCSPTNQIAICTGPKLQILVSSPILIASSPFLLYFASDYDSIEFDIKPGSTSEYKNVRREDNVRTISLGQENDAVAVRAIWSPLGLSEMYGCVLAVLDSHHRVSIWQATGVGTSEKWIPVANVTDLIFEEAILNGNEQRDEIIDGKARLTEAQQEKVTAYSIAWSPPTAKGEAILVIGAASGNVTFWRFTRTQKAEFLSSVQLLDEQSGVTHLAWSPLLRSKSKGSRHDVSIVLAASCLNGSLHLIRISVSATPQDAMSRIQIQGDTQEIEPKQKLQVTKMAWTQWNGKRSLVMARMGSLTVKGFPSAFEGKGLKHSSSISCRYHNFSPVIDLILSSKSDRLDILLISQLLPITSFTLLTNDKTLSNDPPPNEIQTFFQSKSSELPTSTKPLFKIYGVHSSPTNRILTFFYDLVPNDRPQYRTALDYKTRLSSMVLGSIDEAMDEYVQSIGDIVRGKEVEPVKFALEGRVLFNATLTDEEKLSFAEKCVEKFEELEGQTAAEETMDESSGLPLEIAVSQYWIAMDTVIKFSSNALLPQPTVTRVLSLNTCATSAILKHLQSKITSLTTSPLRSHILSIYDAFTTSSPSSPAERCGICTEPIPAKSLSHGSCVKGHLFQRCSVMLLTLSTPFAFTCRTCGRKMLDERAIEEDPEWCQMALGEEVVGTVLKVERCVYCGGEWYRKL